MIPNGKGDPENGVVWPECGGELTSVNSIPVSTGLLLQCLLGSGNTIYFR